MKAAESGHDAIVALLLTKKADPTICLPVYGTALLRAAKGGHMAVVHRLIAAKSPVNAATEKGGTPLFWAVRNSNEADFQLRYRPQF